MASRVARHENIIDLQTRYDSIDLLSLYVLFSHFRPRDALMGICLLFSALVMRTFARA